MELKDKYLLSSITSDMWAKFSDAADYRKKLDVEYSGLLKLRDQLNKIDCKTAEDFETISKLTAAIDNFYQIDNFPTWEDYERFAEYLDKQQVRLEKEIEKEENE
jgi:hypothetical protein